MGSTPFDALTAAVADAADAAAAAKNKHQSLSNKRKIPRSCTGDNADSVGKASKTLTLDLNKTVVKQCQYEDDVDEDSYLETKKKKKKKVLRLMDFQEMAGEELKSKISLLKTAAADFQPKSMACWGNGVRVPFLFLCQVFDLISQELGRNNVNIACNMLRTVMQTTPRDLLAVVHLSANKIAPKHELVASDLGVGLTLIINALAEAYGTPEEHIKDQYKMLGDLGKTAETIRMSQSVMFFKPQPLTVSKVFKTLVGIAKESGRKSKSKKMDWIKELVMAAGGCEVKYIIRLLTPKTSTRIGFSESTLLEALGQAAVYNENPTSKPSDSPLQEAAKIVKQAHSVCPVYDNLISAILSGGVWNLSSKCCFSLGVPVEPMLAKPIVAISEIVKRFDGTMGFACEYKYDGERAQIHCMEDGKVEIYTRNLEPSTEKFPDVVIAVSRLKKPLVKSFVLDCEIVAYDRDKQEILPFQILSTRRRKNVSVNDIKVQVCIFAFDMLYLNGDLLYEEQLKIRKNHLYESFEEEPGFLQFATALTSANQKQKKIEKFLKAAIDASCEGLVIKALDGTYEPAMYSWLKLKKDYMEGIGDSLDLVPIAAYYGRGKLKGVYGAFLLACYDSKTAEFESICKLDTGFSKKILTEVSSRLLSKVTPKPKSFYRFVADKVKPDVWFEPSEVWEVKAGCLTVSPVYCAAFGMVEPGKGLSTRLPSLVRVRKDKDPEQASSSELIVEMYHKQFVKSIK